MNYDKDAEQEWYEHNQRLQAYLGEPTPPKQDKSEPIEINPLLTNMDDDELDKMQADETAELQAQQYRDHMKEQMAQENADYIAQKKHEADQKWRNRVKSSYIGDLVKRTIEPTKFVVQDILPQGLTLVTAPPKFGKSFFVAQLCLCVATKTPFLGFTVNPAVVAYLSLEDTEAGLQYRASKIIENLGIEIKEHTPLQIIYEISPDDDFVGDNIYEKLEHYILTNLGTSLLVIDTFGKVREDSGGTEYSYKNDVRDVGRFKELADKYNLAIILVHHTNKGTNESDNHGNISGTNGILGTVDTSIVMKRDHRSDKVTKIDITGRKSKSQILHAEFDHDQLVWKLCQEPKDERIEKLESIMPFRGYMTELAKLMNESNTRELGKWISKINSPDIKINIKPNDVNGKTFYSIERPVSWQTL